MNQTHRVLVFGNSLFVQAILVGLRKNPTIDAFTLDRRSPLFGLLLRQANPELLIIEVGGEGELLTEELLTVDVPILVVNIQSGSSKLLTGESLPIVEERHGVIGSLVPIINQIEMGHIPPLASLGAELIQT